MSLVRLAGHMLKNAAREFSKHGCNDFSLDGYLTRDEQILFVTKAHTLDGSREEIPNSIKKLPYISDFAVMATLGLILDPRTP